MESRMTGILDRFYVEHGAQGVRVMARTAQLTGHVEEDDIDEAVDMLKDDLDACAREMKRLIHLNRVSLFEGWPTDA
jgi:hypothetical protein